MKRRNRKLLLMVIALGMMGQITSTTLAVETGTRQWVGSQARKILIESPDKQAIIKSMTQMPTVIEKPYDKGIDYHKGLVKETHAFSSMYCSVGGVNLDSYGYIEKEYFMSGKANVYGLASNEGGNSNIPIITKSDNDYTTRFLVRYPSDPEKFTGKVYIDILNASSGVDLEDLWRRSYEHIMKEGHAYIGITSKSLTANALKQFDGERYEAINWQVDGEDENGIFWDMLGQLGTYLKDEKKSKELFGKEVTQVYLGGQSQSGFYLNTFLNVFYPYINNINNGKDLFDGYINLVGWVCANLAGGNTKDSERDVPVQGGFAKTEEPFIVVMSEMEAALKAYERIEDKNEASWKFRLYEVAGAPHADPTSPIIPNNYEIAMAKADGSSRPTKPYQGQEVENDLNINEVVSGALRNLDLWATQDIPAPAGSDRWIEFEGATTKKDELGNTIGGVRIPLLDAPIAKYNAMMTTESEMSTEGSMIYLTKEQLDSRYEGKTDAEKLENYQEEFKVSADKLFKEGYITQRDYEAMITYSQNVSIFGNQKAIIEKGQTSKAIVTDVTPKEKNALFNSTKMSIGNVDKNWNDKAPIWVPNLMAGGKDGNEYIQINPSTVPQGENNILKKYIEKEYFVTGEANLYYVTSDNQLGVKEAGLPYNNRMIIRMPKNPKDFSGKVYVDILNASDKYDNESLWRRAYQMIIQEGHGYVGITSKPVTAEALKKFGQTLEGEYKGRYDSLSWDSPNTYLYDTVTKETIEQGALQAEIFGTDIGLVWDILSQAGYAINEEINFGEKKVDAVYLYGQSQSGFVMNTYFLFQEYLKNEGIELPYNGFMNVVGTYPGYKINQSDPTGIPGNTETLMTTFGPSRLYINPKVGVPVVYVTSQMDFNPYFRPDEKINVVDEKERKIALYEIAGAPHSDPVAPVFPNNEILQKMGYPARDLFPTFDQNQVVSDYNSNMFVQGLLVQLDKWAQKGIAPKKVAYMPLDEAGKLIKDEHGNALGGLRSPQIDVPVATYYEKPMGTGFATSGTQVYFDEAKLKKLYPTEKAYKGAFYQKVDELFSLGLIREIDAKYMRSYADKQIT